MSSSTRRQMAPWNSLLLHLLRLLFFFLAAIAMASESPHSASSHTADGEDERMEGGGGGFGRRFLLSFKETPRGSNVTFDCAPSGPCVPCLYSEKNDEKYRCSETGYRIPLKCVEIEDGSKDKNGQKSRSALEISHTNVKDHIMLHDDAELIIPKKQRSLLDDSSRLDGPTQAYITYRSCIPLVNEEKLSVLGFEGIVLCMLLISGSVIYFRRKQTVTMPGAGAGRIQANSRF